MEFCKKLNTPHDLVARRTTFSSINLNHFTVTLLSPAALASRSLKVLTLVL